MLQYRQKYLPLITHGTQDFSPEDTEYIQTSSTRTEDMWWKVGFCFAMTVVMYPSIYKLDLVILQIPQIWVNGK